MTPRLALLLALVLPAAPARAQEDAPGAPPFKEGDVLGFEQLESLKRYLPAEFWANREFFFYEGMKLEIGPAFRDYSEAPEYLAASKQFSGQARIGPENSLEGYTAGRPFDMAAVDCAEQFPAASHARTVYMYVVLAARPLLV